MVEIRLDSVVKRYDDKVALDNVTIKIPSGKFTCIFGPPLAGKTTLLKVIAGVEKIDEGSIFFDDQDVTTLPPHKRGVRFVFETPTIYPHLNVYDNIAFPLRMLKMSKEQIDRKVREVAELLKISNLLDRTPREISGGEMQRVAIGRALVKDAEIYLFDQPLTNLDYKIREDMRREFKELHERLGKTVIFATPDAYDVLSMAHNVVILKQGKVETSGDPLQVYLNPPTLYTASIYGVTHCNLIESTISQEKERLMLNAKIFKVDVTHLKEKLGAYAGKEVVVSLRPEHVHLGEKAAPDRINVKGKVSSFEVTGAETIVDVDVEGFIISALLTRIYRPKLDEEVWLNFKLEDMHVFDGETGKLIL